MYFSSSQSTKTFAKTGPSGLPILIPSTCSYKMSLKRKDVLVTAAVRSFLKSSSRWGGQGMESQMCGKGAHSRCQ